MSLNQTTQIKSQAEEANHVSGQSHTARLPAHPLLLWLRSCLVLLEQVKDVAFLLSSPLPDLSKQKKAAAYHSSQVKLGKQVLLTFPQ